MATKDRAVSYEAEELQALTGLDTSSYLNALGFSYLSTLLKSLDPKSDLAAKICGYFEDVNNYKPYVRPDYPASRAAFNQKLKRFNETRTPVARKLQTLNIERARLEKELLVADVYEKTQLQDRLRELIPETANLRDQLKVIGYAKPRDYRSYYKQHWRTNRIKRAKPKDISYLTGMFDRQYKKVDSFNADPVHKNLTALAAIFELPEIEQKVLSFLYVFDKAKDFQKLVVQLASGTQDADKVFFQLMAVVFGVTRQEISAIFAENSNLYATGIIMPPGENSFVPSLNHLVFKALEHPDITVDALLDVMVGTQAETPLTLSQNFNYVGQNRVRHVAALLKTALETEAEGVNVLLYGLQDAGKTEFIKALGQESGFRVFMISEKAPAGPQNPRDKHRAPAEGRDIGAEERLAIFAAASKLTRRMKSAIRVLDEAETMLKVADPSKDTAARAGVSKIVLNRALEKGPPTVWIVNDIQAIHPSVRRRFKYAIDFQALNAKDRLEAWSFIARKKGLDLPQAELQRLAHAYTLPIGAIVTAVENAILTTKDVAAIELSIRSTANLVFGGISEVLSTDAKLEPFSLDIANFRENRFGQTPAQFFASAGKVLDKAVMTLAWGPQGAGKKTLFRNLAAKNAMRCLTYNFIDLFQQDDDTLDIFIREAAKEPTLVMWENVDVLFQYPESSPVVKMVREKLAQLQDGSGCMQVFLANSNGKPPGWVKDPFAFCAEFDYLTPAQVGTAYRFFFGEDKRVPADVRNNSLLTPGRFATIQRRFRGLTENPEIMQEASASLQEQASSIEVQRDPAALGKLAAEAESKPGKMLH